MQTSQFKFTLTRGGHTPVKVYIPILESPDGLINVMLTEILNAGGYMNITYIIPRAKAPRKPIIERQCTLIFENQAERKRLQDFLSGLDLVGLCELNHVSIMIESRTGSDFTLSVIKAPEKFAPLGYNKVPEQVLAYKSIYFPARTKEEEADLRSSWHGLNIHYRGPSTRGSLDLKDAIIYKTEGVLTSPADSDVVFIHNTCLSYLPSDIVEARKNPRIRFYAVGQDIGKPDTGIDRAIPIFLGGGVVTFELDIFERIVEYGPRIVHILTEIVEFAKNSPDEVGWHIMLPSQAQKLLIKIRDGYDGKATAAAIEVFECLITLQGLDNRRNRPLFRYFTKYEEVYGIVNGVPKPSALLTLQRFASLNYRRFRRFVLAVSDDSQLERERDVECVFMDEVPKRMALH
ncbi:hypothetical protein BC829DRAFT_237146 [Chytridium lagenaria]|nr:hypothetical protein BC829DRAFT_237146 [Chytridium lagenaria]